MCGLCKLNAAALDTTVACGYNGIDQHNLGLLPPIAGIDMATTTPNHGFINYCPPSRGLILSNLQRLTSSSLLPPIAGIDTLRAYPCAVKIAIAPPLRGLILHAASGQLLNSGAPSTILHPPSAPPLCVPLPTFHSGEVASAIRKRLQKIYLI